nr:N(4)-acetylcytidine aminohydrolase [Shewanella maritima]
MTDIQNGAKTITIRDFSESHYRVSSIVDVYALEDQSYIGKIKVLAVKPINFDELNEKHALQENMTLCELQSVIRDIYPGIEQLFVIEFELV